MAAPQTGLTSCQIGDMGHPGTVRGNTILTATHIALNHKNCTEYFVVTHSLQ